MNVDKKENCFLMFLRFSLKVYYMYNGTIQRIEGDFSKKLKSYVYDIIGCCIDVHSELGCWLNEYIYQDALEIAFRHKKIKSVREHQFSTTFQGERLSHVHKVDFLVKDNVIIECKAVAALCTENRQQLWNYLRLTKTPIGILYNFAPSKDQCEKYYYNVKDNTINLF